MFYTVGYSVCLLYDPDDVAGRALGGRGGPQRTRGERVGAPIEEELGRMTADRR